MAANPFLDEIIRAEQGDMDLRRHYSRQAFDASQSPGARLVGPSEAMTSEPLTEGAFAGGVKNFLGSTLGTLGVAGDLVSFPINIAPTAGNLLLGLSEEVSDRTLGSDKVGRLQEMEALGLVPKGTAANYIPPEKSTQLRQDAIDRIWTPNARFSKLTDIAASVLGPAGVESSQTPARIAEWLMDWGGPAGEKYSGDIPERSRVSGEVTQDPITKQFKPLSKEAADYMAAQQTQWRFIPQAIAMMLGVKFGPKAARYYQEKVIGKTTYDPYFDTKIKELQENPIAPDSGTPPVWKAWGDWASRQVNDALSKGGRPAAEAKFRDVLQQIKDYGETPAPGFFDKQGLAETVNESVSEGMRPKAGKGVSGYAGDTAVATTSANRAYTPVPVQGEAPPLGGAAPDVGPEGAWTNPLFRPEPPGPRPQLPPPTGATPIMESNTGFIGPRFPGPPRPIEPRPPGLLPEAGRVTQEVVGDRTFISRFDPSGNKLYTPLTSKGWNTKIMANSAKKLLEGEGRGKLSVVPFEGGGYALRSGKTEPTVGPRAGEYSDFLVSGLPVKMRILDDGATIIRSKSGEPFSTKLIANQAARRANQHFEGTQTFEVVQVGDGWIVKGGANEPFEPGPGGEVPPPEAPLPTTGKKGPVFFIDKNGSPIRGMHHVDALTNVGVERGYGDRRGNISHLQEGAEDIISNEGLISIQGRTEDGSLIFYDDAGLGRTKATEAINRYMKETGNEGDFVLRTADHPMNKNLPEAPFPAPTKPTKLATVKAKVKGLVEPEATKAEVPATAGPTEKPTSFKRGAIKYDIATVEQKNNVTYLGETDKGPHTFRDNETGIEFPVEKPMDVVDDVKVVRAEPEHYRQLYMTEEPLAVTTTSTRGPAEIAADVQKVLNGDTTIDKSALLKEVQAAANKLAPDELDFMVGELNKRIRKEAPPEPEAVAEAEELPLIKFKQRDEGTTLPAVSPLDKVNLNTSDAITRYFDDAKIKFDDMPLADIRDMAKNGGVIPLPEIIPKSRMLTVYPYLNDVRVGYHDGLGAYVKSSKLKKSGEVVDVIVLGAKDTWGDRRTDLRHEIEHIIQHKKGLPGGADPDVVGMDAYLASPGEIAARKMAEIEPVKSTKPVRMLTKEERLRPENRPDKVKRDTQVFKHILTEDDVIPIDFDEEPTANPGKSPRTRTAEEKAATDPILDEIYAEEKASSTIEDIMDMAGELAGDVSDILKKILGDEGGQSFAGGPAGMAADAAADLGGKAYDKAKKTFEKLRMDRRTAYIVRNFMRQANKAGMPIEEFVEKVAGMSKAFAKSMAMLGERVKDYDSQKAELKARLKTEPPRDPVRIPGDKSPIVDQMRRVSGDKIIDGVPLTEWMVNELHRITSKLDPATGKRIPRDLPFAWLKRATENPLHTFENAEQGVKGVLSGLRWWAEDAQATHMSQYEGFGKQLDAIQKDLGGLFQRKRSRDRLIRYFEGRQPRGENLLEVMGKTPLKFEELSAAEKVAVNKLDAMFKAQGPKINDMRTKIGLDPIELLKDYYPFVRDIGLMEMEQKSINVGNTHSNKIKAARQEVLKEAIERKGGKYRIELDPFKIADRYFYNTTKHINMSPVVATVARLREPFKVGNKTFELAKRAPRLDESLATWGNFLAGWPTDQPPRIVKAGLAKLSNNLAYAMLAGNFRTFGVQISAIKNVPPIIGLNSTYKGILDLFDSNRRTFAMKHSPVLRGRDFNEVINDFSGLLNKFQSSSVGGKLGAGLEAYNLGQRAAAKVLFAPMKAADMVTAQATWLGAFDRAGKIGLKGDAAFRYADDVVVRTQGSAMAADISPIQRGAYGRALTLFQTFAISDWNFLTKDILGIKRPTTLSNREAVGRVVSYVVGTMLFNSFYEDLLGIQSPFPSPLGAVKEGIRNRDDIPSFTMRVLKEGVEQFPVIGGSLKYGSHTLGAVGEVFGQAGKLLSPEDRNKIPYWKFAGQVFGVPMTAQISKSYGTYKREGSPQTANDYYRVIMGLYKKQAKGGGDSSWKIGGVGKPSWKW